ncbi:ubiquinol oxidase subunit II [Hyphomicrobium sp.]|uniref:ubiquinol oxidase subunit II n=1 Tax=Hyphomicrobium sp. TaxID=82 RepID=UPI002D79047D|nr:ubiquinol oxidase subunit II [Hyphomicrobium sp.]HET6388909.1 ubiquinol oxidase subunit II [Hyphomicrobium sp.]
MKPYRIFALLPLLALLGGCNAIVMNPAGDVAVQQRDLIIISTVLMLLIIVPVMALTALFAWRYRESNKSAPYDPDWDHSTHLELVIWAAPLLIIICLGAVTWMATHLLDPFRPLARTAQGQAVAHDTKPLKVDVVALDWKWLFIYPEQGIATVNEMAAPVDRPIHFRISASSVMNAFYVPALAGMIYAMPGMQTQLHAVINEAGDFDGFSANYSGEGFSKMRFKFLARNDADFDKWVSDVKAGGGNMGVNEYLQLEKPSEGVPVQKWASVDPELFHRVVNLCVQPGKMCMHEMAAIDAKGGLGLASSGLVQKIEYDKTARRGSAPVLAKAYVASVCTTNAPMGVDVTDAQPTPVSTTPLLGAGLPMPGKKLQQSLAPRPSNS